MKEPPVRLPHNKCWLINPRMFRRRSFWGGIISSCDENATIF